MKIQNEINNIRAEVKQREVELMNYKKDIDQTRSYN